MLYFSQIFLKRSAELLIIGSIFPEKLEFDGKTYRTARMNVIANYIFQINNGLPQNKNRTNGNKFHLSCLVAGTEQISKHFLEDLERLAMSKEDDI